MRPGTGCSSCRLRHLKCVVPDGHSTCTRCLESGRRCEFLPRYRFRRVDHVDTASQGLRSRTELQYENDQQWVGTAGPVRFVLEDGLGLEYGATELEPGKYESELPDPGDGSRMRQSGPGNRADDETTLNGIEPACEDEDGDEPMAESNAGVSRSLPLEQVSSTNCPSSTSAIHSYMTPASVPELTRRYVFGITGNVTTPFTPPGIGPGSDAASPATSLPTPGSMPVRLKLTRREAFLMQHYIDKIAPWVWHLPSRRREVR